MKRLPLLLLLSALTLAGCHDKPSCEVTIGDARCTLSPNTDARLVGLASVGGHAYLSGGHRGVVVIRTGLYDFVAFERTCPCDNNSRVELSQDWTGLLECPTCHSCFDPLNYGYPFDGSATPCPLYQYSTRYDGGLLYIY